jgi:sporulation protein YlmC with PRC-barrel domain
MKETIMNRTIRFALVTVVGAAVAGSLISAQVSAQVAGSTLFGGAYAEMRDVATGWSAKRELLGQPIYNEKNERVGSVDDLIVSPSKALSYAIIGAGGFLGVAKHDVLIPVNQFTEKDGKFILEGASKDAIKAMPQFEYAPR